MDPQRRVIPFLREIPKALKPEWLWNFLTSIRDVVQKLVGTTNVPTQPYRVIAVDWGNHIKVSWDIPLEAHSFRVYRSATAAFSAATLVGIVYHPQLFFEDYSNGPAARYYWVRAANALADEGPLSVVATVTDSFVNVLDAGLTPGGDAATNTTAFEAILASGAKVVYFPGSSSTYEMDGIDFPTTLHRVYGDGETVSVIEANGTFTSNHPLWYFGATTGLTIENLGFTTDVGDYPTVVNLLLQGTTDGVVTNVATEGGLGGIQLVDCIDLVVEDSSSLDTVQFGMVANGTSSRKIIFNRCKHSGDCTSHGITVAQGVDMHIFDSFSELTEGFGFNGDTVENGSIMRCRSKNTLAEGVNTESCQEFRVWNGHYSWDDDESAELGMSIIGDGAVSSFCSYIGNTIIHCGKAGIGIDGSADGVQHCTFANNHIINPGILANAAADFSSGVVIYGSDATYNKICNNTIFDNLGNLVVGVCEQNAGGVPNGNQIYGNSITGQSGAKVLLLGALSTTDLPLTYTPTITSGSGTLTTKSGTIRYHTLGTVCYFSADLTITTNGTGGTSIISTLPYTPVGGVGHGRANLVSGKQLQAVVSGSNLVIVNYDNTYPGASGEQLLVEGFFEISGL